MTGMWDAVDRWGRLAALLASLLFGTVSAVRAEAIGFESCRLKGVAQEAMCGELSRPLDPTQPLGRRIAVHVAVLPAVARNKQPDPIVFFAGGPGQSAIDLAGPALTMLARFTNRRDIVLIDQRGTGRSAPLECDKADPWMPLARAVDVSLAVERRHACAAELQKLPHGDTRQYTTTIAVGDVEAVREALGVPRINLVGVSYGTRVALEYMRRFPQRVRSAVLDGVVPPGLSLARSFSIDNQMALEAVFDACAAEPSCRARYPELRTRWAALLSSLPRPVTARHPMHGERERFTLNRQAVLGAVRRALYVPTLTAILPAAIEAAAAGRFDALVALGSSGPPGGISEGMHFAVLCSEEASNEGASTYLQGKDFGDDFLSFYREVCKSWPLAQVKTDFMSMAITSSPTLLLSGQADPATPARHGDEVATKLGRLATHVVAQHATHGLLAHACMREMAYQFVEHAERTPPFVPDPSCAERIPRPRAYLPPRRDAPGLSK